MKKPKKSEIDNDLAALYTAAEDFGEKKAVMEMRLKWEAIKRKGDAFSDEIPIGLLDTEESNGA